MKILFAVHTYNPDRNGVQIVTNYLAEELVKLGCKVFIITEKRSGVPDKEIINGVKIFRIYARTTMLSYKGNRNEYIDLVKKIAADIFIPVCTQSWTLDWLPENLEVLPGKKVLYTHGYSGITTKPVIEKLLTTSTLKNILAYFIFKCRWGLYYLNLYKKLNKFDLITYLCSTDAGYTYAQRHHLKNAIIIANGVEERFFERYRENSVSKVLKIICVSNYSNIKNQMSLLKSFYLMNNEAELFLFGSKETNYMRHLVEAKKRMDIGYGKKIVHFCIGKDRDEIADALASCNVFATTSKVEAYPIAVFEAMAVGLPIIAFDAGNIRTVPGTLIVKDEKEMAQIFDLFAVNEFPVSDISRIFKDYTLKNNKIENIVKRFHLTLINLVGEK